MRYEVRNCSGCKACENICPTGCLKIETSDKYHFAKVIEKNKCVKCKMCIDVCPMKNGELHKPNSAYIAYSKNKKIAKQSASGGVASTIYYYCLDSDIACVGVHFDEKFHLNYEFIENKQDVNKSAGSKYVYSDMNNIYKQIEEKIKEHQQVVFIGLPCHVSGLKNYCAARKVSLENLYTVDIVCHGVPMPFWFQQHLTSICKDETSTVAEVFFRKKDNEFGLTIENKKNVLYKKSRYKDEYMIAYQNGHYGEACYSCRYATSHRCGDLTIMDCSAGPEIIIKGRKLYNASEVLVNSFKGEELLEKLRNKGLFIQDAIIDNVIREDSMLQHPSIRPRRFRLFYQLEKKKGFTYAVWYIYGLKMMVEYMKYQLKVRVRCKR